MNKITFAKMKMLYLLMVAILIVTSSQAQPWKDFDFEVGDILFQDLDCGDLCDAIETVTPHWKEKRFSHAGIVFREGSAVFVIEAIGKDVHSTPIDKFMQRQEDGNGKPKVVVGRLKKRYQHLNEDAVNFALMQNNVPYDGAFLYDNGKYYCTELIYDAYIAANNGKPFFQLFPMTFKDPATGNTFPAWVAYYKELSIPIPEGKPGCNPGSVATDKKIRIVKSFY